MISNIYARRDDIELVSPERVSKSAKAATLPDFERSFNTNTKIGMDNTNTKIGRELNFN